MKFKSNARPHLPLDRLDKVIFTPFGATDTVAPLPIQKKKYRKIVPRKWRCIPMMRIRITLIRIRIRLLTLMRARIRPNTADADPDLDPAPNPSDANLRPLADRPYAALF
jgi:hypothetical protein